ncbi:hypothetical protein [Amycolatopsis pigmentata]|uniref:Beta-lactamase class A n=1 Tax=Amycolatopsis pigmentata TaxID=450801 RepID=A0ABW5G2N3_9PSEU
MRAPTTAVFVAALVGAIGAMVTVNTYAEAPGNQAAVERVGARATTEPATPSDAVATGSPSVTTTSSARPQLPSGLAEQMREAVQDHVGGAQAGVEVFDQQAGQVVSSVNADQQFAAMSVAKIFIAVDALRRNAWTLPDQDTRDQLTRMISDSDDAVADDLWGTDGGPEIITRTAALMGLTATEPPDDPGEWGDTRVTARDMVTVYRYLSNSIPRSDRDFLYQAMAVTPRTAADGSDQYFGIPDGLPHHVWAVKQGWGSSGNDAYYNTTGTIGTGAPYIVVMLVTAPLSSYQSMPAALTAGMGPLATALDRE